MKVNLDGMLQQAGRAARGVHAYSLEELGNNLREMRERHAAGDGEAALTEFFDLYVTDVGERKAGA